MKKATRGRNCTFQFSCFDEEAHMYDAVFLFSHGASVSEIAKQLGTSRHRVVALFQQAFSKGLVQLPSYAPSRLTSELERVFPGVLFRVISSRLHFSLLAARQVLQWTCEACQQFTAIEVPRPEKGQAPRRVRPYVAIGGGTAMRNMVLQIPKVLEDPENEGLRDWYFRQGTHLCCVNATAGYIPREPTFESSYLTGLFAQCTNQESGIYSLSADPTEEEADVIESALKNTCVVVSGIGAGRDAYCIRSMCHQMQIPEGLREESVGEFLFHTFDSHGESLWGENREKMRIEVKEDRLSSPGQSCVNAVLATLFHFESLRGRPAINAFRTGTQGHFYPRFVVGVATSNSENTALKGKAAYTLLRKGFFTHMCISSDLANGILTEAGRPERDRLKLAPRKKFTPPQ